MSFFWLEDNKQSSTSSSSWPRGQKHISSLTTETKSSQRSPLDCDWHGLVQRTHHCNQVHLFVSANSSAKHADLSGPIMARKQEEFSASVDESRRVVQPAHLLAWWHTTHTTLSSSNTRPHPSFQHQHLFLGIFFLFSLSLSLSAAYLPQRWRLGPVCASWDTVACCLALGAIGRLLWHAKEHVMLTWVVKPRHIWENAPLSPPPFDTHSCFTFSRRCCGSFCSHLRPHAESFDRSHVLTLEGVFVSVGLFNSRQLRKHGNLSSSCKIFFSLNAALVFIIMYFLELMYTLKIYAQM